MHGERAASLRLFNEMKAEVKDLYSFFCFCADQTKKKELREKKITRVSTFQSHNEEKNYCTAIYATTCKSQSVQTEIKKVYRSKIDINLHLTLIALTTIRPSHFPSEIAYINFSVR